MTRRTRIRLALTTLSTAAALSACGSADEHSHEPTPGASAAFEDAYEQTEFGKADSSGCSGVVVPDQGPFQRKVALTFDDGPNPDTTPGVLDILGAHGIKATFFINGKRVSSQATRDILQRILNEGHILANHSHDHLNLKTVSASKLEAQVKKTHEIIVAAGEQRRYFRFPFGSANCSGKNHVEQTYDYAVTGWHTDSADWCFASGVEGVGRCAKSTFKYVPDSFRDDMVGYTLHQVKKKEGGIVLFHDIHENTKNQLNAVIEGLKEAQFTFVNIDDQDVFPTLNGLTPPPKPFVGDTCKDNSECAFTSANQTGKCHLFSIPNSADQGGFCSISCEGTCPDQYGKAPTFCTSLDGGATGSCVSKASLENQDCEGLLGTTAQNRERFIGSSSASPATAKVCVP